MGPEDLSLVKPICAIILAELIDRLLVIVSKHILSMQKKYKLVFLKEHTLKLHRNTGQLTSTNM